MDHDLVINIAQECINDGIVRSGAIIGRKPHSGVCRKRVTGNDTDTRADAVFRS